jgi:hypothetical protein
LHSATRTSQIRHRRDGQEASVVQTFSLNSLIDNERRPEKPSNPRRRVKLPMPDEILSAHGYSAVEIASFRERGVVR